jgi:hypothetical protein
MKSNTISLNLFLVLAFVSFLTACSSQQVSDVQVVETDNKQEITPEIVRINNCGGMADTEQTATRSFSTSIEGAITAKLEIKLVAEGGIYAKYGEARNTSKSITLIAPPGTNMEFTLQWTEQTWIGRVTAYGEAGSYTFRAPLSVDQIDAKNLGCDVTPESANWAVTFEYRFPPGSWSIGTHQYHFDFSCPSDILDNNGTATNDFSVSDTYPSTPTEIYLRWGGVRTSKLVNPQAVNGVNPSQTTIAVLTWSEVTKSIAERIAATCNATVNWDGGTPQPLIPQTPFQY